MLYFAVAILILVLIMAPFYIMILSAHNCTMSTTIGRGGCLSVYAGNDKV